jgi:hypothetical protein
VAFSFSTGALGLVDCCSLDRKFGIRRVRQAMWVYNVGLVVSDVRDMAQLEGDKISS